MLKQMENLQSISNEDLIQKLSEHGIAVEMKNFNKKRDIYIKQLNHQIAKRRKSQQVSPTRRGRQPSPKKKAVVTQSSSPRQLRRARDLSPIETECPSISTELTTTTSTSPSSRDRMRKLTVENELHSAETSMSSFQDPPNYNSSILTSSIRYVNRTESSNGIWASLKSYCSKALDWINSHPLNYIALTLVVLMIGLILANSVKIIPKTENPKMLPNDEIQKASTKDDLMICDQSTLRRPCFQRDEVSSCLALIPYVRHVLDNDFIGYTCNERHKQTDSYIGLPFGMMMNLAEKLFRDNAKETPLVDEEVMTNLLYNNEHWRVKTFDKQGLPALSVDDVYYFRTNNVRIPILCTVKMRLLTALQIIGQFLVCTVIALLFSTLVYFTVKTFQQFMKRRQEHRANVHKLAQKIVESVRSQFEKFENLALPSTPPTGYAVSRLQNFVVVRHLHDTLIPLEERDKLQKTWSDAVELIKKSESRIRSEVRLIDGEHVNVWVWKAAGMTTVNDTYQHSTSLTPQIQQQSVQSKSRSAVAEQRRAVNRSPARNVGLTNCLKIRNILPKTSVSDPQTSARVRIREAANQVGSCGYRAVLDVGTRQLSDGQVAVYVRCTDETASHRLNETVKMLYPEATIHYLLEERFLQQFENTR